MTKLLKWTKREESLIVLQQGVIKKVGDTLEEKAGVLTAGEWNDLEHWSFWQSVSEDQYYLSMLQNWAIYNNHRIAINVRDKDGKPFVNAILQLKRGDIVLSKAMTDNAGNADLWVDLFQKSSSIDLSKLQLDVDEGREIITDLKSYDQGINRIKIENASQEQNKIEVAFVVDATGSMGDELEFLKRELNDVISKVKTDNANAAVSMASVFYRDQGDEYLTKVSDFTVDIPKTINFIKAQRADGGGDFPEAVHTALNKAMTLQWSSSARAKLLFLVLDAPPHFTPSIISSLHATIECAQEKGIKIIPIVASGIDKNTEFLMRHLAISTNGTYVFLTDDSGVGDTHLKASVGAYDVEQLNNLMNKLINKYAKKLSE